MLSRVADSIYWMSRYIERAENVARFVDVNLNLTLDLPNHGTHQWRPLVDITGETTVFLERYHEPSQKNVIQFLTFDTENPNSILSCLRSARDNARSVREVISSEMWQQVNESYLFVADAVGKTRYSRDPQEVSRRLLGEELLLQPARSWWCGNPDELTYALEHTEDLVFKRSLPGASGPPTSLVSPWIRWPMRSLSPTATATVA
jgi:uncharacterized alpha-E superfamily protein